ncbi:ABC transporter substrate-binding protein [Polycladidibacter hongkongensis]|uniref:ABC transporter substrate-binding protein n=1 Tax=Polycladidibacter hongkongensis TaxID=1647556 RepID=UPI00082AD926|nr:sugar ABC transporter substrate-binding protein [Pseudovibrio hongkongensis]
MARNFGRKLLISCAVLASTSLSALADDIKISFRFNDSERKEMRAALDEFEQQNPGIKVDLQTISWKDSRDQFLREAAVGQGPDVVHIAFVWTQEMAEAEAVTPVEELTKYGAFSNGFNDYIATDLTMYDGKAYGVPWSADTWAMVYRTDVLHSAGIMDKPETWDELKEASRTIKEKTGNTGFAFPAALQVWFPVNYYLWSNGASFITQDGKGGYKVGVSKEQLAGAMDYFKGYVDEGLAPRSILSIDQPHDPALMQALLDGKQAMAMMPTNTYRQLLSAYEKNNPGKTAPFDSGVMMHGTNAPRTHLGGRTLVVNSNTKHPEASWKLLQYLASAPLFEKYYTNQFPAQKTLLSQIEYRHEELGFAEQLANNTRTWGAYAESGVGVGPLWNTVSRAFGTALSGQESSEKSAEKLIAEIERMLAK